MDSYRCLILTPWWQAHQLLPWQISIGLEYTGKIDVLERYEETVSSPSVTIQIPAVARINGSMSRRKHDVKFSRSNVYTRDEYRCSYCGRRMDPKGLNYDHVLPRSRGGKTDWHNVATACIRCNTRKDNRTPEEAGMQLRQRPYKPSHLPMVGTLLLPREVPEQWKPYLQDRLASLQIA